MTQLLPNQFPRFAESFRVYIDDDHGWRRLTSEWMDAQASSRHVHDDLPQLLKAGRVGLIARTAPRHLCDCAREQGMVEYYGDKDYPVLYWHWKPGATDWEWPSDEQCMEWSGRQRRPLPLGLIKLPRDQEWRP